MVFYIYDSFYYQLDYELIRFNLLILFLFSTSIFSQQISFSKGYTENGEPIDSYTNGKAEVNQSICILLDNGKKSFDQNLIFIFIEEQTDEKNSNRFSKLLYPDKNKNWIVHNYKFTKEGIYKIYFTNFNRTQIAKAQITITPPEKKAILKPAELDYFPNVQVIFCETVSGGKPINIRKSLSMKTQGGQIYIYLSSNRPFNTEKLLVNIFRKKHSNSSYEEFADSKKYKINSTWYDTFFKYRFQKSGEYKINFFDEKEILIKTAYITVED